MYASEGFTMGPHIDEFCEEICLQLVTSTKRDPVHRPAVKSRPILTLRPPKLSGRDAEHLTEVTRQVALVGKPHGIRNLRQ
jgi:hypothetical protein